MKAKPEEAEPKAIVWEQATDADKCDFEAYACRRMFIFEGALPTGLPEGTTGSTDKLSALIINAYRYNTLFGILVLLS